MPPGPTAYAFGDLLALARSAWLRRMAEGLAEHGFHDYRRTDAAIVRSLRRGPVPVGRLGDAIGASRQAARKAVDGLEARGFATTRRSAGDGRRTEVILTQEGQRYAAAVVEVIGRLNADVAARVDDRDLVAADVVLRAAMGEGPTRERADRLVPPPPSRTTRAPSGRA